MSRLPTRHEILELSVAERVQLIERIWDTIDANQLPLPESHRRALDEAIDEYGRLPEDGRPWDEVRDDLFRKK